MKKHQRILKRIIDQRRKKYLLAKNADHRDYRNMFTEVFGPPSDCLVCGTPTNISEIDWKLDVDIDAWFCSSCCPVCSPEY